MTFYNINAEIAEKIMGWRVDRTEQRYHDPNQQAGFWEALPDFLLPRDNELLRQTMKSRGYELTVTDTPPDVTNKKGRTFTASCSRQGKNFQATQSNEQLAVCLAALALEAHGLRIANDQ